MFEKKQQPKAPQAGANGSALKAPPATGKPVSTANPKPLSSSNPRPEASKSSAPVPKPHVPTDGECQERFAEMRERLKDCLSCVEGTDKGTMELYADRLRTLASYVSAGKGDRTLESYLHIPQLIAAGKLDRDEIGPQIFLSVFIRYAEVAARAPLNEREFQDLADMKTPISRLHEALTAAHRQYQKAKPPPAASEGDIPLAADNRPA